MKQYYTVDSILFPGEKTIFDAQTGQELGHTAPGLLGDTLIYDNRNNNIGFAVDSIFGGKNIFLDDNNGGNNNGWF